MKTVQLGTTGERISELALGAMIMGTRTPEPDAVRMLDAYLDAGGNFLDTADCYCWWERPGTLGGQSEELLGRWLSRGGRRDRVFLATKGSGQVPDQDGLLRDGVVDWGLARQRFEGAGGDTLRRAVDASLRRLGTDHIDLYYVHVDDLSTPLEETLEALAGIVAAGKVRYLGWSNVRTWRLERIRQLCDRYGWPAPVALQQLHTYLRPRTGVDSPSLVGTEQLDYLRAHEDLTLVAYSPLLKGSYDAAHGRAEHRAMADHNGPDAQARLAALEKLAGELAVTPNQLVLAWLRHSSPTVVPLIGPRTPEQLAAALPAVDIALTAEQVATLSAAGF